MMAAAVGCDNTPKQDEGDTSQTKQFGPEGFDSSKMARPTNIEQINPRVSVKFIGRHKGDDPKPRHLTIMMVDSKAYIPGGKLAALESLKIGFHCYMLEVEPEASGLSKEEAAKLGDHLRGPDFFNTKQYPTAEFETTSIKLNEDGTGTVVGNLTLLDQKKELTIPVKLDLEKKLLEAKFDLDRTEFGMNFGLQNIEEIVEVQISLDASKG